MKEIQEWAKEFRCYLNNDKTKIVVIRGNGKNYPSEEKILGFSI